MSSNRRSASQPPRARGFLAALTCLLAAGCGAAPSVPMAPAQSPHFGEVSSELALGGTFYLYADIEGDEVRATEYVMSLLRQAGAPGPSSATGKAGPLVKAMGLADVDAIGMSSYPQGELFHNKTFVHRSGPPAGVFQLIGGEPEAFTLTNFASSDTDLIFEQQLDLRTLIDMLRALGDAGLGSSAAEIDRTLDKPVPILNVTWRDLFDRPETKVGMLLRLDPERIFRLPGESFWVPFTEFLVLLEGFDDIFTSLEERASLDPFLRTERKGGFAFIGTPIRLPPPWNAYQPTLIQELESGRVFLASSPNFFDAALRASAGVTKAEDYQTAFRALPQTGNGMLFLSRTLTREMHGLVDRWVNEFGVSSGTSIARVLLPKAGMPVGWVGGTKGHGSAFMSNSPSSHKATLVSLGVVALVPVMIAMSAGRRSETPQAPPAVAPE
ncbi:MAG: hypothetical protein AAF997_20150 [Myxococcota bacterium]